MRSKQFGIPVILILFIFGIYLMSSDGARAGGAIQNPAPDGAAIYQKHCAVCHDNAMGDRMPTREALGKMSAENILSSLVSGRMMAQGSALTEDEKRAVSEFLSGGKLAPKSAGAPNGEGRCPAGSVMTDPAKAPMWNGWGADPANTRYQPAKSAGLTPEQVSKLKLKWAFGFPGGALGFAQPTIVAGRVFIGSDRGVVYSLDARTGCTHWSFNAGTGVRTAISIGKFRQGGKNIYGAFFGDLAANVYGLNAETGDILWKVKVDEHQFARITGAPTLHEQRLYVPVSSVEEVSGARQNYECCTFRGSVVAIDITTGKQIWKAYTIQDSPKPVRKNKAGTQLFHPAGAAIWSAPTIDLKRKAIYVATGNAYTEPADEASDAIIALSMDTGKRLWIKQLTPNDSFVMGCRPGNENCPDDVGPDHDFGNSPILREIGGGKRVLAIGQKSGVLWGIDPDKNGEILWQFRAGKGGPLGGLEWGSAADLQNVYAPVSDRTIRGQAGGLFAVKLATGEKVWAAPPAKLECTGGPGCNAAQSAAISVIPGVVFSGAIDGHLRAYSTKDGSVIWDFNTAREFQTVNGVKAKGGSLDSAGPTIVAGFVYTNSGYGLWGGIPGNVLLAFSIE